MAPTLGAGSAPIEFSYGANSRSDWTLFFTLHYFSQGCTAHSDDVEDVCAFRAAQNDKAGKKPRQVNKIWRGVKKDEAVGTDSQIMSRTRGGEENDR